MRSVKGDRPDFDAGLVSRGKMAAALACALAEMEALEQDINGFLRSNQTQGGQGNQRGGVFDSAPSHHMLARDYVGEIHDFSRSKHDEIERVGTKVSQVSLRSVMAWNVWQQMGRFGNEINPQAYLGRIDGFFDKTAVTNERGMKAVKEVFEEVWQTDKAYAQRVEEALILLRGVRESFGRISAAMAKSQVAGVTSFENLDDFR
jgi:hypothetical protein